MCRWHEANRYVHPISNPSVHKYGVYIATKGKAVDRIYWEPREGVSLKRAIEEVRKRFGPVLYVLKVYGNKKYLPEKVHKAEIADRRNAKPWYERISGL